MSPRGGDTAGRAGDAARLSAAVGEAPRQEAQRQTRVDDVLDEQHVAAGERPVEVLEEPNASARATAAVRRELDDIELVIEREGAREVGENTALDFSGATSTGTRPA